ncbi:hypothetical protein GGI20_001612 [Coemansia sp. BCRC 34301]|nr:hypothetical protein GGI20_001612 [Coemansia sp. BCRC 34301]
MGNTPAKDSTAATLQGLGLHSFVLRHVIGRGAFGKVRVVEHVETGRSYALKYISKRQCELRHGADNILRERAILEQVTHSYIASLRFSFQTPQHVFLVLDLMQGGDLRFHLRQHKRFPESIVRLWVAQLSSAIDHLHTAHGIVHRDIKPENVLMDHAGHVALTDFNAAIRITEHDKNNGIAGTTSYMAPELIGGNTEYGAEVDWWSLGVLMYECVFGYRPFRRSSRDAVKRAILESDAQFPVTVDSRVSMDCISTLRGLLHKVPGKRLGSQCQGGVERIKAHPFFAAIDWDALEARDISPLFVPDTNSDNFDKTRVNASSHQETVSNEAKEVGVLDREFANFDYIEYLTFKAYVEQHGSVTAEAVADAVGTHSVALGKAPLLQLRLDGRSIVPQETARKDCRPFDDTEASSTSLGVRRRITTRAVSRLKRMNPSMASLAHSVHSSSQGSSEDTLPNHKEEGEEEEEGPPCGVPIDASAWRYMLPSQKVLAIRYSAKIALDQKTAATVVSQPRIQEKPINVPAKTRRQQLRHWPSMGSAGNPRLAPIAAAVQWQARPASRRNDSPQLVHKTNYPQLNSDPVIVAMAAEIADGGWEVVSKSAALGARGRPWAALSPKTIGFSSIL